MTEPVFSKPYLGVITATHNRLTSLRRLHASLSRQRISLDWVHVVVDDHSSPAIFPEAICANDAHLVFIANDQNSGPLISRNRALDIAMELNVDMIAFIDDDDDVTEDFFEYIVKCWKDYPDTGWYVTRCIFVGEHAPSYAPWPALEGLYDYARDLQLYPKFYSDMAHVFKAGRIGELRFSTRGRFEREWTLLAQIAKSGGLYASTERYKFVEYLPGGITLAEREPANDPIVIVTYLQKSLLLLRLAPTAPRAWARVIRQLVVLPVRALRYFWQRQW